MLTMSVSSTLTSAVTTLMSARVISVEPFGILNADDDGFAFADRQVGHEAVKGRNRDGLSERVLLKRSVATCWFRGVRAPTRSAPWPG